MTNFTPKRCMTTAAFLLLHYALVAAPPPPPPVQRARGYSAFKLVQTLNIFDPDRRPLPGTATAAAPAKGAAVKAGESSIVLTGTMISGSKALAFFTGSDPADNKVLHAKDTIGDFTIASISSTHVDLDRGGKSITLAVGKKLSADGAITAAPDAPSATPDADPGKPPGAEEAAAPSAPGSADEIRRRMMERREKELSK